MKPSICPLCEQDNRCQANLPTVCWCMAAKHMDNGVPTALIGKANKLGSKKSCICQRCIETYEKNSLSG